MNMDRPHPDWPLVVAYGLGVNSTALLVEFVKQGIRPDLILFADTGGEKPETYAYQNHPILAHTTDRSRRTYRISPER
jgi:3'-phosphoadenosine 5'-phosphosulfate sulfotransferase (PAPS reductase)/FAD synthetase